MPNYPPEVIDLPAGVLTRLRESDGRPIAAAVLASLEYLRPWMPWATFEAARVDVQQDRCREAEKQWDLGGDCQYVLRPEPHGPVIGSFGLHRRVGSDAIEIGYWMHVDYAGRGYGTAAAAALTDAVLELPDITRVEIHTDEANARSAAIPQRLGYRLDRVDTRLPQAPGECGRLQIWVRGAQR
jgi:RimJ/RimL family protein N-acetyltransferase